MGGLKAPQYLMLIKVNWDNDIAQKQAPVFYEEGDLVPTNVQESGDKTIITHTQKVDHILAANKRDRDNTDENWKHGEAMKLAARIPLAIWLEWQRLGITEDPKLLLEEIRKNPELKATNKRI